MTVGDVSPGACATEVVRAKHAHQVLTLVLNRPGKRNAFNAEMVEALGAIVRDISRRDDVRALVLTGEGGSFAAGADISEYAEATPDQFRRFTEAANAMCSALANLPIPVVAAVDGVALGGGFEVVLCCDLVVATPRSSFGLPETSLGLIPGWGGTQALSNLIGPARTRAMVLTGARMSAEAAHDLGVVHQLCQHDDDVVSAAEDLAQRLARRAPRALAAAKRAIAASPLGPHPGGDGHAIERAELMALFDTDESREGIAAFIDKREPIFTSSSPANRAAAPHH